MCTVRLHICIGAAQVNDFRLKYFVGVRGAGVVEEKFIHLFFSVVHS